MNNKGGIKGSSITLLLATVICYHQDPAVTTVTR